MAAFPLNHNLKDGANFRRINCRDPSAPTKIVSTLTELIPIALHGSYRAIVCIGSDRSTGDALGPIVGTFLSSLNLAETIILGTLAHPVHALNLESTIGELFQSDKQLPLAIAVDASLGKPDHIGTIEVGAGPLYPGIGVKKDLPPIGHLYLNGVVNIGGFMEQMVLQSTRLFQVMELAVTISAALQLFLTGDYQNEHPLSPDQPHAYLWEALTTQKNS